MKIVSDFDGVWTDPAPEAAWIHGVVAAELARLAGASAAETEELLTVARHRIAARPERYGWAPDGRIAAFADEDLFGAGDALVTCLHLHRRERVFGKFARAIDLAGFEAPGDFADHCFRLGGESYRDRHPPALVPGARAAFEALSARGFELVIVSNARADKVIEHFAACGIDAGEGAGHAVRVRGEAGKQRIGSGSTRTLGGRRFHDDRPLYRAALEEERPDLVVGDVFSLDLLQPHALREAGHPGAPRWLVLRRQAHTPRWVWRGRVGGAVDALIDDIGALVPCSERLVRAGHRVRGVTLS